jgi:UvrB/uvrC motif
MSDHDDISHLLSHWAYDPDSYVREIIGADGRRKLQVRFPMGVEQYELDGRPDGVRPMDSESYLHYFLERRQQVDDDQDAPSLRLTPADCEALREEALTFSYRYELLYLRKDYERVVRDTARNLAAFDLMSQFADSPEDCESMEIYRPQALRLHYASRALLSLRRRKHDEALRHIRLGIQRLDQLERIEDRDWLRRRKSSLSRLKRLGRRIRQARPLTQRERLQIELRQAVDREDYEVAAELRDRLASLASEQSSEQPRR